MSRGERTKDSLPGARRATAGSPPGITGYFEAVLWVARTGPLRHDLPVTFKPGTGSMFVMVSNGPRCSSQFRCWFFQETPFGYPLILRLSNKPSPSGSRAFFAQALVLSGLETFCAGGCRPALPSPECLSGFHLRRYSAGGAYFAKTSAPVIFSVSLAKA